MVGSLASTCLDAVPVVGGISVIAGVLKHVLVKRLVKLMFELFLALGFASPISLILALSVVCSFLSFVTLSLHSVTSSWVFMTSSSLDDNFHVCDC